MRKIFLISVIFFLTLIAAEGNAGNTRIQGIAKSTGDMEIRLMKYWDYISMETKEIASTKAGEDGKFSMDVFLSKPELLIIRVGFKEATFFAEPGKDLSLEIDYKDKVKQPGGSLPFNKPLDLMIRDPKESSLNQLIFKFDSINGEIFPENRLRFLLYKRDIETYDSLKLKLLDWAQKQDHPYLNIYAEYRLGKFKSVLVPSGMRQQGEKMLAGRKIRYRNMEYMIFFKSFVKSYVPTKSKEITPRQTATVFEEENATYAAFDNILGQDTVFRNEQLRELAMIVLLRSFYHDGNYDNYNRKAIFKVLDELIRNTKFKRHRQIAVRVKKELKRNEKEKELRNFSFALKNKDSIRLKDYQGRYLLINFFTSDCIACLLEMDVMKKLHKEKTDLIYLLSVSLDDSFKRYKRFLRNNDYSWDIAYFGKNYDMVDFFGLKTIPHFVLVNPKGKIIQRRFQKLSKGGLRKINKILPTEK